MVAVWSTAPFRVASISGAHPSPSTTDEVLAGREHAVEAHDRQRVTGDVGEWVARDSVGVRVDEEQRDAVAAPRCEPRTRNQSADARERHEQLGAAFTTKSSPRRDAEHAMASDASAPSCSSTAGMTTRSPAAILGSSDARCASVPAERTTSAATATASRCGTRHEEASHLLVDRDRGRGSCPPPPPNSAGIVMPNQPRSAISRQCSGE